MSLKAGSGEPSTFLHFLLVPATDLNQPAEAAPAVVKEIYRTAEPIPDLKPGGYDLNLTRVTFPARMPSNAPHHRSGAALYYIVSGTGANTVEGKTEQRGPGSLIYEPFGLVHQWGNPGDEPLTFLAFNINPDGVPAVVAGAQRHLNRANGLGLTTRYTFPRGEVAVTKAPALKTVHLRLPASTQDLAALELGTVVYLTGRVYTAREGVYKRAVEDGAGLPAPPEELGSSTSIAPPPRH